MDFINSCHLLHQPEEGRQSANFHPTVWDEFFISMTPISNKIMALFKLKKEELKVEVRKMLIDVTDASHSLELIDRIQCLGVAYHFEKEIEDKLFTIHETGVIDNDLHTVSLYFRLLRQQKYHVPCDVFNKFLDENGEFKVCLNDNVKALLSLYEAAYLSIPGEEILDKALEFSKTQLKSLSSNVDPCLSKIISSSLKIPLVRRVDRLKAKHFISYFEGKSELNGVLLSFAKLDFALLQAIHQDEARNLSIWWKDLNLTKKLPFIRDRLLEGYFWFLSTYFEPHYSRARVITTKVAIIISIMDDIYDVYGTIEELQLLTDVIESWELENIKKLPQYMQDMFLVMYNTYKAIEAELESEQYEIRVQYAREQMKQLSKAYLQEAKWANDGYVPKLDEYLRVSLISCAYNCLTCSSCIGMHNEIPKGFFYWVSGMPQIMKSINFICRIVNDIASHEHEQKRKHVASAVQCYTIEHGCSEEEACKKLRELVEEEWKILNREFMFSNLNVIPIALLHIIVNLAKVIELIYKDVQDTYTDSTQAMKDNITALLVEPIQINLDIEVTCTSNAI